MKKLIKYLYYRFCEPDVVGMTRKQLSLYAEPVNISKLSENKQQFFYASAYLLQNNETLNVIFDELVSSIKDEMLKNSEPEQMIYDRFSINGISLIKERIEAYASLRKYDEKFFDKYSIT